MEQPLSYRVRIQIYKGEKCFGPGIAELLTRVQETGSLRAAAGEMDLAYSKAWRMVKNSEAALGYKLLISQPGGKTGGGPSLSPEAKDMLRRYEEFVTAGEQGLDALFGKIFQGMVAP